jgi:hypothetical protein
VERNTLTLRTRQAAHEVIGRGLEGAGLSRSLSAAVVFVGLGFVLVGSVEVVVGRRAGAILFSFFS